MQPWTRFSNPYVEGPRQHPGWAPEGEYERVLKAISQAYDYLYRAEFHKETPEKRVWKAWLHSPTGPIVWAEVDRATGDVSVYKGGGMSATVVYRERYGNPFRGSGKKSPSVVNIEDLVKMFGLPEFEGSYNEDYVWEARSQAEKYARSEDAEISDEDAEAVGFKAEQEAQDEVYGQWHNAVESVAENLFKEHGLELTPKRLKKNQGKYAFEYTVSPVTSWEDAANKIRETINGVGYFEFNSLREFLDSGPWTAREAVFEHLGTMSRYPEVYGSGTARSMYDRAWR